MAKVTSQERRKAIKYGVTAVVAAALGAGAGYLAGGAAAPQGAGAGATETATVTATGAAFPNGVVKLGLTAMLTGTLASEGDEFLKGATLAAEEINAQGGILGRKLEIYTADTEDTEAGKISSAWETLLTRDAVDVVITGYGGNTQFEVDTYAKKYNMVYLMAAEANVTEATIGKAPDEYPTVYNLCPSYTVYQTELPKRMEKWANEGLITLSNRKVAIITSDNTYSRYISEGLRDNFKALGWTNTVYEMVAYGTVTEWGPILSKIRADPPDLIVNTDYIAANEATFMEQFLGNPTKSYMFIQYGPSTPEFVNLLGDKSDGVLYNLPNLSPYIKKYAQGGELNAKFKARWGFDPGFYGPHVYLMPYIYKSGVEKVGNITDHVAIGKAIGTWTAIWGPGGLIAFDPRTHLASSIYMPPSFYQLWGGQRMTIDPEEYADAKIKPPPWFS